MSSIIAMLYSAIANNPCDDGDSSAWSDDEDEKQTDKPLTETELFAMQQKALNSEWMLNVPMVKWSNEQLGAWASTLTSTELEKQTMSNDFDGSKLLQCRNYKELMKQFPISEAEAKELFEEIQVNKKVEKQTKYSSQFAKQFGSNTKHAFTDATRWKTRNIAKWTVQQTAEWIKSLRLKEKDETEAIEKIYECEFDGEIMCYNFADNGATQITQLSQILDIKPSIATIICMAAQQRWKTDEWKLAMMYGHAEKKKYGKKKYEKKQYEEKKDEMEAFRDRSVNTKRYPHIILSNDKDIIMKYDNDDGILRAKMPGCGHAMAAETMYFYIKSVLEQHLSVTEILCPDPKCRKQWDWSYCVAVADMNEEEMAYWNKERQQRIASVNYRECPHCGIMCDKPDTLGTLRVRCGQCGTGKSDWCWICRGKWISWSKRVCGNKDCKMVRDINDTLAKAELFDPMGFFGKKMGVKIPEIRACPICMTIVHHIKQDDDIGHHCKHVTCPVCRPQLKFCFICLGVMDKDTKKWPCGSYYDTCKPHGIQRFE